MSRDEIARTCREVIYECLPDLEGTPLNEDTVINTDTGIDSMGFTLIICRLEARFDIRIPSRQWAKLSTFGDVVTAIEKKPPKPAKPASAAAAHDALLKGNGATSGWSLPLE